MLPASSGRLITALTAILALCADALAAGVALCTTSFDIAAFDGSTPLSMSGSAQVVDPVLRLTTTTSGQSGSAWYSNTAHVSDGFHTRFTFQISNGTADGFAFVIQNDSTVARGGSGSALGYGAGDRPGIMNSLAVEFDTFSFSGEFEADHVSVQTRGVSENSSGDVDSLGHATIPEINDGQPHTVDISYLPGTLRVYVDATLVFTVNVDLQNINGDDILDENGCALIGFTGATGGATADQDILSWSLNNSCVHAFNESGFTTSNMTFVGSAASGSEDILILTPNASGQAGAAWYINKAQVAGGFDTTFSFLLDGAADGIAFVIQNEGASALGSGGSGIGYGDSSGPGITFSLAVEIDTFSFGEPNEFNAPHVSLQTNGAGQNSNFDHASLDHADIPNVADGFPHEMRLVYAPGNLKVSIDGVEYLSVDVDLADINGSSIHDEAGCAYIGFTGATGAAAAAQYIMSWSFGPPGCANPPCERTIVEWRSKREHTSVGGLNIVLDGSEFNNPTIETRVGGIQEIQMVFDGDVSFNNLGAYILEGQTTTNGVLGPPVQYFANIFGIGGNEVSLYFDAGTLPDQTCYTLTILPEFINEPLVGDTDVRLRSLEGDSTGSGTVTLSDAIYSRQQALAGTTAVNAPWLDLDVNGTISTTDALAAKARVTSPAREAACSQIIILSH
jgi:hypothetical protein